MSIDRLLTLLSLSWKNFFRPKQTVMVCLSCIVVFMLVCLNVLLNYGEVIVVNGTTVSYCYTRGDAQTAWMTTWDIVSAF